jgi:hypothetical protein
MHQLCIKCVKVEMNKIIDLHVEDRTYITPSNRDLMIFLDLALDVHYTA